MNEDGTEHALAEIEARGFTVLRGALSAEELGAIRATLAPWLEQPLRGRNNFEGHATQRIYSLVARGAVFERLAEHPGVLAICDALLEPGYLLTASQSIRIDPGETEQLFHTDDSFYSLPRPRPPVSVSTIFAIDAFTEQNGGTQVVPGSHRWGDDAIAGFMQALPAEFEADASAPGVPRATPPLPDELAAQVETVLMQPGDVVVFPGTLLHRGGANGSDASRLALSNQYCQPWARTQENYFLSVAPEQIAAMSERVQKLLGYSIHPPFMGHANGLHPLRSLEADPRTRARSRRRA